MGVFDYARLGDLSFEVKISTFNSEIDDTSRTKTYTKDIPGISADRVTVTKRWVNRTKKTYLNVTIDKGEDEPFTEEIDIDTKIYDSWSYSVEHGVLKITLYEINNEEPKFEQI